MDTLFKYIMCLLRGGHKYVYIGRVFMGIKEGMHSYRLRYGCLNCPHIKYVSEEE